MSYIKLAISIVVSHLAGIVGTFFTVNSIESWYTVLERPVFNPPNWIFGPVWLTLYTLMGIALYIVWQKGLDKRNVRFAFIFFLVHLIFNALWSIVFFGMQNLALSFVIILILVLMILVLTVLFWKIDKRAAFLLMPYLVWVSFAALLNYSIWQLNM